MNDVKPTAELAGILDAVRAEPEADVHRLAAADWWDDHGEEARAAFVRTQVALAVLDAELMSVGHCGSELCAACREREELEARQRNLLQWPQFWEWFGPVVLDAWPGSPAVNVLPDLTCEVGYFSGKAGELRWRLSVRRGFVEEVAAPLGDWVGYSAGWLEATPLRAYRPFSTAPSPRDEIVRYTTTFWQDENVGRLRTLDLTGLLAGARHASAYDHFMVGASRAYRPWRGLKRVVLPGGFADLEQSRRLRWRALIPGVEVEFRDPEGEQ